MNEDINLNREALDNVQNEVYPLSRTILIFRGV